MDLHQAQKSQRSRHVRHENRRLVLSLNQGAEESGKVAGVGWVGNKSQKKAAAKPNDKESQNIGK